MHIRIINPNTTGVFTERNLALGLSIAAPGTVITSVQPSRGVASIESHAEEAIAAAGVVEQVLQGEADGVDGYVIACFGDTGVHAGKEIARGPVIGMSEAALHAAALVAHRFAIVTLPLRTHVQAQRVVMEAGLDRRCLPIRAIDVDVRDCTDEQDAVRVAILIEARMAMAEDHAEAIILGCAGLSPLVAPLTQALGVPVIDGVAVAIKMAELLISLGLSTSKASSFAFPPDRQALVNFGVGEILRS